MALVIVLAIIVIGSIVFNFFSPWWFTPIASNWAGIDNALIITFWICGAVFLGVGAFTVYAVHKFRTRPGMKADYEPENKKLETWLTSLTAIGVVGMLAPGLLVWADYVNVPEDATEVEVLTQQWTWLYRFPGDDGQLGTVDIKNVAFDNPFGMNPDDPAGQDDILVNNNDLHLALGHPVKILLRSKDVLHNFYVPQFRAKMDAVPGMVSYMWLEPTRTGTFPVLCAELCGVGHYQMKGTVTVDTPEDFEAWLATHPTYAESLAGASAPASADPQVERGRQIAQEQGCLACHSSDGTELVGPTWQGLWGRTEALADGSEVVVDADYLRESIVEPNAKLVQGFAPVMLAYELSDEDMEALIAYLRESTRTDGGGQAGASGAGGQDPAARGRQLIAQQGCNACHSLDGSVGVGPSWQGLFGKQQTLADGSTITVDEAYIKESITDPNAKVVQGYPPVMIPYQLSADDLDAIVAFTKSGL